MVDAIASVIVQHPPNVVWDYIIDPDHAPTILPGLLTSRADKRPPYLPGDLWRGTARFAGVTYDWTGEFTRIETHNVMEFRSTKSKFPFATIDTLEEVDVGTRYTAHVTSDPTLGGPIGRLVDAVTSMAYRRMLAGHLAHLPLHIDAWATNSD